MRPPRVTQIAVEDLLDEVTFRVYEFLQQGDLSASDVAKLGKLVLDMAKRKDELALRSKDSSAIQAFPAMPPLPPSKSQATIDVSVSEP